MVEIYYVEDDLDIANHVKTYLEMRHMEVVLFPSITAAKQAIYKKTLKANIEKS